ncbi:hypothetical protein ABKV19_008421, partial [Rosa sericea]
KISGIQQGQDESYAEYYERFKSLVTQCPQHGMKEETLLTCFYDGLTSLERDMLDAASGQTHHGNQINAISTDVNEMKKQMSQVVEFMGKFHEQGKLPSGTIPNPHFEQAKAVTTRSGKTLVAPPKPQHKISTSILEEEEDPATSKAHVTSPPSIAKPNTQGNASNSFNSVIANPSSSPLPFPSRYAKSKKDEAEKAILETFKKVQINIPLLEAIKQIPKYAKFLKEFCTTRRQNREKEVVKVSENVSAVLQRRMPEK